MANSRLTRVLQALVNRYGESLEPDALTQREAQASTALGDPNFAKHLGPLNAAINSVLLGHSIGLLEVRDAYLEQVLDCTRLAEQNIVFKAIIDKLARTISEPETLIFVPSAKVSRNKQMMEVIDIFRYFKDRTDWEDLKNTFTRRMLNEGGLSWETIVSTSDRERVRRLEYRPHHRIRPLVNENGRFINNQQAYRQVDSVGGGPTFARWQIIDANLVESAYHNRGIPHLAVARNLLENIGMLVRGLVQKWVRQGGSIEHFNIENSERWGDVKRFRKENQEAIEADPDSLVRKFFTKGKVNIERITGEDSGKNDTEVVDFLLELIFMVAGTPKVALGFETNMVIKDAASLAWQNYLQTLDFIETKLFYGLRRAFEFELLLHGINPESIEFKFIGGEFKPIGALEVSRETIEVGAHSINDIRRAMGFDPDPDPVFDIPGLTITPQLAATIAEERGVAPKWLKKYLKTLKEGDQTNQPGNSNPKGKPPDSEKQRGAGAPDPERAGAVKRPSGKVDPAD